MKRETLKALNASIRKWQSIVAGTGVDKGGENCALCKRFNTRDTDFGCERDGELCPVAKATGNTTCYDSPYDDWLETAMTFRGERTARDDESVMCAVLELEFLKSLRPGAK